MYDRVDVYEHSAPSVLEVVVACLLILFFPIGVIVLLIRTYNKHKKNKAEIDKIHAETHSMIPECLLEYHNLYKSGVITENEYNRVRRKLLKKSFLDRLLGK